VPDTITEDLADQQDGHLPARVPRAEYLRDERTGGPRLLRPPGKRDALPDRQPSHHRTRTTRPPRPGKPAGQRADAGTGTLTSAQTSSRKNASADPVRACGPRPWPSVKKPTVHTDRPDDTDALRVELGIDQITQFGGQIPVIRALAAARNIDVTWLTDADIAAAVATIVSYLDDHVSRLLTAGSYQEETGRQLAAACGELSQLAGWVAYDSDEHGLAQRYLTQALAYSRHASDHALAAEVLAGQAHQALYLARPDEAVDLARAAQAAALRHGSATLLTECLVMEAHGHAARNDARACGAVLARAEQTFDRAAREDDPAWLSYFDEAYLAARMAQCFRDLGEAGHAARYARRSLDMDGRYVRGRAFNLSLLATAYAAQGEPVQASVVGRQALDLTVCLTSARSVRYVRDLVRALRPQADVPAVRDFTAEVRERLPAAAGHAAPR
jgi:hypothetical protein